jgi:Uma2 family endonuclease
MGQTWNVHLTNEEYRQLPDDGNRYEILDGEIAVTPAPTPVHQTRVGRLHLLLHDWAGKGPGGRVYLAPIDVHLAFDTIVQPDLLWIAPGRVKTLVRDTQGIYGAPDLVVEVLSPGTASRDRTVKAAVYARHGVREYWLVDESDRSITILALVGSELQVLGRAAGDQILASSLSPELVVVPAHIFADEE